MELDQRHTLNIGVQNTTLKMQKNILKRKELQEET